MRTIQINIKYNVGDRVWIMKDNYPVCLKITKITVDGGIESTEGSTPNFGRVTYYLDDRYYGYVEEQLCDTFEELRDRVFSDAMRENIEQDKEKEE